MRCRRSVSPGMACRCGVYRRLFGRIACDRERRQAVDECGAATAVLGPPDRLASTDRAVLGRVTDEGQVPGAAVVAGFGQAMTP